MQSKMMFRGFSWPNNPHSFKVEYRRELLCRKLPLGGCYMQDLGKTCRVFTCEGEFTGESAYKDFLRLANLFEQGKAGLLSHPNLPAANVYLTRLELEQEPMENFVSYKAEFRENSPALQSGASFEAENKTAEQGPSYYVLTSGDSFGSVAAAVGITAAELLALNPTVKNTNLIGAGDRIRVS